MVVASLAVQAVILGGIWVIAQLFKVDFAAALVVVSLLGAFITGLKDQLS